MWLLEVWDFGGQGLSQPEAFLWDNRCSLSPPPFGSEVKAQLCRCSSHWKWTLASRFPVQNALMNFEPILGKSVWPCSCWQLASSACKIVPQSLWDWSPPFHPSPLHPLHPAKKRKAFKRLCIEWTMLCRGIQETLCPIARDLNEVMILLFPFPPAQDFSTQTSSLEGMGNVC